MLIILTYFLIGCSSSNDSNISKVDKPKLTLEMRGAEFRIIDNCLKSLKKVILDSILDIGSALKYDKFLIFI
ncbi:hypothetical protein GCM10023206_31260 [Acinetobacter puyangensis]